MSSAYAHAKFNYKPISLLIAAGFTEEWSSNLDQRVARRQIAVQASNGPNSTEYRTVRASTSGQQQRNPSGSGSSSNPMQDPQEERK